VDGIYAVLGLVENGNLAIVSYKPRVCFDCPNEEERHDCPHEGITRKAGTTI
jgi:hypothetical protein